MSLSYWNGTVLPSKYGAQTLDVDEPPIGYGHFQPSAGGSGFKAAV